MSPRTLLALAALTGAVAFAGAYSDELILELGAAG